MEGFSEVAYREARLVLSVVDRGKGELLVALTRRLGATGGTVVPGRGCADSALLELLGLGDTEKDLVFTLADAETASRVLDALRADGGGKGGRGAGIALALEVPQLLRHVALAAGAAGGAGADGGAKGTEPGRFGKEYDMRRNGGHALVAFILNKGWADDAMAAARKAGATGGTVVAGRGTGREEDVRFFGITLVPEKEILLVLVEDEKADAVLEAVKTVPCLAEPGSGIAFRLEATDFVRLGKLPS